MLEARAWHPLTNVCEAHALSLLPYLESPVWLIIMEYTLNHIRLQVHRLRPVATLWTSASATSSWQRTAADATSHTVKKQPSGWGTGFADQGVAVPGQQLGKRRQLQSCIGELHQL